MFVPPGAGAVFWAEEAATGHLHALVRNFASKGRIPFLVTDKTMLNRYEYTVAKRPQGYRNGASPIEAILQSSVVTEVTCSQSSGGVDYSWFFLRL